MYWGRIDDYNSIAFCQKNQLLASFIGTEISGLHESWYVNFFAEENESFDWIILSFSVPAFETDNHAYRLVSEPKTRVPEPNYAMGLLMFGAVAYRLRKAK